MADLRPFLHALQVFLLSTAGYSRSMSSLLPGRAHFEHELPPPICVIPEADAAPDFSAPLIENQRINNALCQPGTMAQASCLHEHVQFVGQFGGGKKTMADSRPFLHVLQVFLFSTAGYSRSTWPFLPGWAHFEDELPPPLCVIPEDDATPDFCAPLIKNQRINNALWQPGTMAQTSCLQEHVQFVGQFGCGKETTADSRPFLLRVFQVFLLSTAGYSKSTSSFLPGWAHFEDELPPPLCVLPEADAAPCFSAPLIEDQRINNALWQPGTMAQTSCLQEHVQFVSQLRCGTKTMVDSRSFLLDVIQVSYLRDAAFLRSND